MLQTIYPSKSILSSVIFTRNDKPEVAGERLWTGTNDERKLLRPS